MVALGIQPKLTPQGTTRHSISTLKLEIEWLGHLLVNTGSLNNTLYTLIYLNLFIKFQFFKTKITPKLIMNQMLLILQLLLPSLFVNVVFLKQNILVLLINLLFSQHVLRIFQKRVLFLRSCNQSKKLVLKYKKISNVSITKRTAIIEKFKIKAKSGKKGSNSSST